MDVEQPAAGGAPPSPPPTWSTYFNDPSPDAFLIHCTDDPALLLSLPRYFLQAASSVFEDMLTVPQPATPSTAVAYAGQNAPGVLAELKLADVPGFQFELLLRLSHRDFVHLARSSSALAGGHHLGSLDAFGYLLTLIQQADRFALTGLRHYLYSPISDIYLEHQPMGVLAVAVALRNNQLFYSACYALAEEERNMAHLRDHPPPAWDALAGRATRYRSGALARDIYDRALWAR